MTLAYIIPLVMLNQRWCGFPLIGIRVRARIWLQSQRLTRGAWALLLSLFVVSRWLRAL
jgi:hypothetical protein